MAETTTCDVLAIAAHPDDVEISCGGTLIKMGKMGRAVGVLDLTKGELGTRGDEQTRQRESDEASRIMGLAFRESLAMPDSAIDYTYESKLAVAKVIRRTRPELIILPHWEQRHPDHLACTRLGYDACYLAGLGKIDIGVEPHRPRKIIYISYYRNTDFSFLVDISDEFEQKVRAVAAYQSQFGNELTAKHLAKSLLNIFDLIKSGGTNVFSPGINIYDLLYTRARQLGQTVGVQFAEAYTIKEHILIEDPQKMPVRSI